MSKKIISCGERIKYALSIRGMKQSDLSKLAKIPKSSLSLYLSGAYEPKQDKVYEMAKVLNVSEAWLWGVDVPMERNANVESSDADIIDGFSNIQPKQDLPKEIEAINTLLYHTGRCIIKTNDKYYLDECGELSENEINELINTIILSVKNATDVITAKKTKELKDFFNNETKK